MGWTEKGGHVGNARCAHEHTGKAWLFLGLESGGCDHLLLIVQLSWKIARGVLVSEADRATKED